MSIQRLSPMLMARSGSWVVRQRIGLLSAAVLLLGGVLLIEHEADHHPGDEPACATCASGAPEGFGGHAATVPDRIPIAAKAAPRGHPRAASRRVQLIQAIRAPPKNSLTT